MLPERFGRFTVLRFQRKNNVFSRRQAQVAAARGVAEYFDALDTHHGATHAVGQLSDGLSLVVDEPTSQFRPLGAELLESNAKPLESPSMLTWQRGEHADEKTVGPFKLDQKKAWLGSCSNTRRTSSRRSAKSWEFRERHFIVMRLYQNDENLEGLQFLRSPMP